MASRSVPRVLFHVDMDAFYAALEIRENPELEGKPVVVGADPRKHPRGVVLTASYEARKFGVRSAMSCVQAIRLCPNAVFVPPDHIVEFLTPFSVRKILGVGPKTADRFKEIGLETIGDVQQYNRQDLVELFGAFGEYVHDVAMGRDTGEVVEPSGPPESISTETTF